MAEEKTQLNFNSVPKSDAARAEELFDVIGAATKAEALHAMLEGGRSPCLEAPSGVA